MRNLQARSVRFASIIAGLYASIAALAVISQNSSGSSILMNDNSKFLIVSFIAFAVGLISLGLFLASMAHMPTLEGKPSRFMKKTIKNWEIHVAYHLGEFEWMHSQGVKVFVIAIGIFIIFGIPVLAFC